MSHLNQFGKDTLESYLDNRSNRLTPREIEQLGSGIFLARFIMTREGSSKDVCRGTAIARLVIHIHDVQTDKQGVSGINYSYTGILSPDSPEKPALHMHKNGIIPPESYTINDPLHGRNLCSVEGYIRPYERTLTDLLELAPEGFVSIPR